MSESKHEINYRGSKIIGSAQIRKGNALLQHGSILLNHNQELMAELMPTRSEKERSIIRKLLAKKTIPINQLSAKPISFNYFTRILKKNFNFSISFSKNIKLTPYEEELFERFKNKYKI